MAGGVSFTLKVDVGAATQIAAAAARREATDTTRQVFNRATVLTPVDKGRLRAGNQMRIRQTGAQVVGEVFNNTAYAAAAHNGSRAHTETIRPRRRKALKFVVGGKTVFAKRVTVTVPARRGRPWLRRAMIEVAQPRGYAIS